VLVVEDVARLANDIAEGLRDQAMAVDIAYDGHAAAAKLNINHYDVVVLDRDLPGLHGDTICRMIAESSDPAMVLMLTASAAPEERVTGLAIGADDYLAKPFHFPELVLRLRGLARRKPTAQARVLRAGELELDPLHRVVTRAGEARDLSDGEHQAAAGYVSSARRQAALNSAWSPVAMAISAGSAVS
jgi:DNA-binding response OmpR family regulator